MVALDWIAVSVYLAILALITWQSLKRVSGPEDFALAGRRLTAPVLFATMAASLLGGGSGVGTAGETFSSGYVYMLAAFSLPLQTLLVGYFVAPRLNSYRSAQTVGDVMGHHYGSAVRLLSGVLSVCLCAGVLGGQVLAVGVIFNSLLGVSVTAGILLGMGVVLVYSTVGGMWAVVQTDVLQFVLLAIFIPVTLVVAVNEIGGAAVLVESVPSAHLTVSGDWSLALFASTFVAILLGETLAPPYTQRAFTTPNPQGARRAFVASGLFAFGFFFLTATVGLVALVEFPDISPDAAMSTVVSDVLPAGIRGLILVALVAVIMSTCDSFLNSTAVVFVRDIYEPFIHPGVSAATSLTVQRLATLVVGAAAIAFALSATSIIDLFLNIYSLWAPTIVLPLVLAVVWGFSSKPAALAAIVGGAATTAVWTWVLDEPFGFTGLPAGVVANLLAFFGVYLLFDRGARSEPVSEAASSEG